MRRWKQRLKTDGGASLVIALAVFLVLALVSFAVVNSALTNAQRVSGQQEDERTYLAVTSAASLLRERIAGSVVTLDVGEERTVYTCAPEENENTALGNTLKALVRAVWEDTTGTAEPYARLRMEFDANADLDVDIWLTMKDGGTRMEAVIVPAQSAASPEAVDMRSAVTLVFSNLAFKSVPGDREVYELTFREENVYARGGTER